VFRYTLYTTGGSELGEASYAMQIQAGDVIHHGGAQRYRVVSVVDFTEDDSPLTGMLEVEPL
jgi:hypothetical protein